MLCVCFKKVKVELFFFLFFYSRFGRFSCFGIISGFGCFGRFGRNNAFFLFYVVFVNLLNIDCGILKLAISPSLFGNKSLGLCSVISNACEGIGKCDKYIIYAGFVNSDFIVRAELLH